jgi:hypothetical protein
VEIWVLLLRRLSVPLALLGGRVVHHVVGLEVHRSVVLEIAVVAAVLELVEVGHRLIAIRRRG